jgi:hypothetical protein
MYLSNFFLFLGWDLRVTDIGLSYVKLLENYNTFLFSFTLSNFLMK